METKLAESSSQTIREEVRRRYGATARGETSSCGDGCCTSTSADTLGYSAEESAMAPEAANLGLGCGNPLAIASLREGQVVLDLGSGAGFDCFLAARAVGSTGNVIGVDMTHEMLSKARENAQKNGFTNVEFRLGEIEALPVANNSIDVIISNCVINLSPEKQRVFEEAFRVLKPGGRLAVADMVATAPLPEEIKSDWGAYTALTPGVWPALRRSRTFSACSRRQVLRISRLRQRIRRGRSSGNGFPVNASKIIWFPQRSRA